MAQSNLRGAEREEFQAKQKALEDELFRLANPYVDDDGRTPRASPGATLDDDDMLELVETLERRGELELEDRRKTPKRRVHEAMKLIR